MKRGVTELVTPGVATNDKLLDHNNNNFLCGVHLANTKQVFLFLIFLLVNFLLQKGDNEYVDKLLQSLNPAEVIFQRNQQKEFKNYSAVNFILTRLMNGFFLRSMLKKVF